MAELNDRARRLLDGPNLAFLAEVMEDGSPHVSPVWIEAEDGNVTFNTAVGRLKERNIRRNPRVAISVADRNDPYDRVDIRGRVVAIVEGAEADEQIDRLARKYTEHAAYPWRREGERRIKIVVEPVAVR